MKKQQANNRIKILENSFKPSVRYITTVLTDDKLPEETLLSALKEAKIEKLTSEDCLIFIHAGNDTYLPSSDFIDQLK